MGNTLRYLCGLAVLLGVLLVPTSGAHSEPDPASMQQEAAVPQPDDQLPVPADAGAAQQ